MNKSFLKETFGWGFVVWLIGYALGMVFFTIVPPNLIGLFVMPIGIIVALFVLLKKIKSIYLKNFFYISISWTVIAIICDYLFLVRPFKPTYGYYHLDVFIYYSLTFLLPLLVYWYKNRKYVANR